MAIRLDATGEGLSRTSSPPSTAGFTVCGWANLSTDRNTYQILSSIDNGSTQYAEIGTDSDGTTLYIFNHGAIGASLGALTIGTPFFWAQTVNGSGAGNHVGYGRNAGTNTLTTASQSGVAAIASQTFWVGRDGFDSGAYYFDGRIWNVKVWDRVLTAAELLVESFYQEIKFTASKHLHWRLPNASNTTDSSGLGRDATVTGTLSTEDGSHGLWRPRRRIFIPAAAASGAISGTADMVFAAGSSILTGSGALAGTAANVFAAGSSTLAGAGALAGSCALVFAAGSSTLTASGTLAGSAANVFGAGSSTLTGAGALAGSSALVFGEGSSTLTGAGALAGSTAMVFGGSLALSGDVAGAADFTITPAGTLTGAGALAGAAALSFANTAPLAGAGTLAGSAALAFTTAGDLTAAASGAMEGTAALSFGAGSSTLTGSGALLGASAMAFMASLRTTPATDGSSTGGWPDLGTMRERRRTKKELLEERIDVEQVPVAQIEALAPAVQTKVKRAGTITLRALLGTEKASDMTAEELEAELAEITRRTRWARRMREEEELLLL